MNPTNLPIAEFMHSFMAIRRVIRTDEIAELAAYIAGPHGAMMTGAMQTMYGGMGA
jgi:cyclic-di-GMP-binding biofilm dispersal mediator protein